MTMQLTKFLKDQSPKTEDFGEVELLKAVENLKSNSQIDKSERWGFGQFDTQKTIEKTNFLVIYNGVKDAVFDKKSLDDVHYILAKKADGTQVVVLPLKDEILTKEIKKRVNEQGKKIFDRFSTTNELANYKILASDLATAYVNTGSQCYSFEHFNHNFVDEVLREANKIKKLYGENIVSAENKFFIYVDAAGVWISKMPREFLKELLIHFKGHNQASTLAPRVLKALSHLTYLESFPNYSGNTIPLVLKNTAFDPVTQEAFEFDPSHYARSAAVYSFDSEAKCEVWLQSLWQIFGEDEDAEDKIKLLQEAFGLSLTNDVKFQQMFMLYGAGSNGKSLILKVLAALVGEGNVSHVALKDFANKFALARLSGKLVNIDADVDYDAMRAEGRFKSIVAGDEVTVEEKHEKSFKIKLYAKLWVAANVLPKVKNNSNGYYRRINIIEFNKVFNKQDQNKDLLDELMNELPGIFNWALEGLKRLMENGEFTLPESSAKALNNYQLENNHTKFFLEEHLEIVRKDSSESTLKSVLFDEFTKFLNAHNFAKMDSAKFGKELKALGVTDGKLKGKRYYHVKMKDLDMILDDMVSPVVNDVLEETLSNAANDEDSIKVAA
jgi:P4 family phage/plasmid primase-like protien